MLRLREVLKAMNAKVLQLQLSWQALLDQAARGLRHHDLPAMRGGGDPRRVVHVETDVLIADQGRLAGVQTDAHPDRAGLRPFVRREAALGVGRGAARVQRALEDTEERVAFGS